MITAQSVPWIGIIASLVSDLSVLICNSGCYEDCVRARKQHFKKKINKSTSAYKWTWHYTLKSGSGWGFSCLAIFTHCRWLGGERWQTTMGSRCTLTTPGQPFKMTSVTAPYWSLSPKTTALTAYREYCPTWLFYQVLYCKDEQRHRRNYHTLLSLKYLFDLCCSILWLFVQKNCICSISCFCQTVVCDPGH